MKNIYLAVLLLFIVANLHSQVKGFEILDSNFKFILNSSDADIKINAKEISEKSTKYDFKLMKGKDTIGVLVLSFKFKEIRKLSDFIYFIENDIDLNIPARDGDYYGFDSVYFDCKSAVYRGAENLFFIDYYRTKDESEEYNYMYVFSIRTTIKKYTNKESLRDFIAFAADYFKPVKKISN